MAKDMSMEVEGMSEVISMIEHLSNNSILKPLVYAGADVVADELKKQIGSLKTDSDNKRGSDKSLRFCHKSDIKVLSDNMGIAPIKAQDTINTKVGFDGYYINARGDSRPVPLLANSINAGTSFMKAQPFIDKTARKVKGNVQKAMNNAAEKVVENIERRY